MTTKKIAARQVAVVSGPVRLFSPQFNEFGEGTGLRIALFAIPFEGVVRIAGVGIERNREQLAQELADEKPPPAIGSGASFSKESGAFSPPVESLRPELDREIFFDGGGNGFEIDHARLNGARLKHARRLETSARKRRNLHARLEARDVLNLRIALDGFELAGVRLEMEGLRRRDG